MGVLLSVLQFLSILKAYKYDKTDIKVGYFFIFHLFTENFGKMAVLAGTGNLCPKKSGDKLSLKKKKERFKLAIYHFGWPCGGEGGL